MFLDNDPGLRKRLFSEIGVKEADVLGGGFVHSVYNVELHNGLTGVLRVSDQKTESWVCPKERAILSGYTEIPYLPHVLCHGSLPELGVDYNLLSFISGDNMSLVTYQPQSKVFDELGALLAKIHVSQEDVFGFFYDMETIGPDPNIHESFSGPFVDGFSQYYIPAEGWVRHLKDKGSRFSLTLGKILEMMKTQRSVVQDSECTHNHGDYRFKNIIVTPDNLAGVVDFDCFKSGDPSSDIYLFMYDCIEKKVSSECIRAFFDGYRNVRPLPQLHWEKSSFYRYYRAILDVILIPFVVRGNSNQQIDEHKKEIAQSHQRIIEGDDIFVQPNLLKYELT